MNECKICLSHTADPICSICLSVMPRLERMKSSGDAIDGMHQYLTDLKKSLRKDERVVIGVSGGVDSTFLACVAGEVSLPVQLIHFDNGWNTILAIKNINALIDRYDFPLCTHIQDWNTFSSLQRSFLWSGVPDLELISDHAIFATMLNYLKSTNNRFVLSGANFATEHGQNEKYTWTKTDRKNIKAINERYENTSLKKYPQTSTTEWVASRIFSQTTKVLIPLNSVNYKRIGAIEFLKKKIGFEDYEFKHEESLITKVYQRTILPVRYNYFKVEDHLNAMLRNGEYCKVTARQELDHFKASSVNKFELEYFLDKLNLSYVDWERILALPPTRHDDFKSNKNIDNLLKKISRRFGLSANA